MIILNNIIRFWSIVSIMIIYTNHMNKIASVCYANRTDDTQKNGKQIFANAIAYKNFMKNPDNKQKAYDYNVFLILGFLGLISTISSTMWDCFLMFMDALGELDVGPRGDLEYYAFTFIGIPIAFAEACVVFPLAFHYVVKNTNVLTPEKQYKINKTLLAIKEIIFLVCMTVIWFIMPKEYLQSPKAFFVLLCSLLYIINAIELKRYCKLTANDVCNALPGVLVEMKNNAEQTKKMKKRPKKLSKRERKEQKTKYLSDKDKCPQEKK